MSFVPFIPIDLIGLGPGYDFESAHPIDKVDGGSNVFVSYRNIAGGRLSSSAHCTIDFENLEIISKFQIINLEKYNKILL